jgi:hypothetical protein
MRSENGGIFLYLAGPVSDNQGMVKAVILERYPASKILGVTGDYSGLGETGENLIGQRVGDHILFLTPRRFEAKLPSQGPVSITKGIALPMVHATAGQTGVIIGPDYRGMTTIAAYAPLGVQGWGLVVKQDKTEVFSKLDRYGVLLIISVVLLAVTGASIIVPLASALTKPAEEPAGKTEAPGKPQAP